MKRYDTGILGEKLFYGTSVLFCIPDYMISYFMYFLAIKKIFRHLK